MPFTFVASVRELRDGRVLVLDRRDRLVLLVDFGSGTATAVGREGTGPGAYSQPGRLFPLPGDTTAIDDGPARRFVVVEPNGKTGVDFRMDVAPARVSVAVESRRGATVRVGFSRKGRRMPPVPPWSAPRANRVIAALSAAAMTGPVAYGDPSVKTRP